MWRCLRQQPLRWRTASGLLGVERSVVARRIMLVGCIVRRTRRPACRLRGRCKQAVKQRAERAGVLAQQARERGEAAVRLSAHLLLRASQLTGRVIGVVGPPRVVVQADETEERVNHLEVPSPQSLLGVVLLVAGGSVLPDAPLLDA